MGDVNQILFLRRQVTEVSGPILEIGSKDYGSTSTFRDAFPDNPYIGVDMEPGAGVDHVVDLVEGLGPLQESHFGLVVCCSVLEHVAKPWVMAENITRLTRPGGKLYMSVPWVWRYHPYPDDYFRFSFRGVTALFPGFQWGLPHYSTNVPGEIVPITEDDLGLDNRMAAHRPTKEGSPSRKYLPYLMVNMLGERRA